MSTNAPKSVIFLTVPVNNCPSFKSSKLKTSLLNIGFGMSSLGSLPGFFNSLIISVNVNSPISSSCAFVFMSIFDSSSLIFANFALSSKSSFL